MSSKQNYKDINLIRIISCIAVLLYHLGILKGGYLAVCTFFVLSGYLSCISAFNKEKFSIISYYKNKIKKVYFPLIIVVFISIAIISFFKNIYWFNLKPETTSILLGYNNYWQLKANLDYFAHHISSPFMHLWYISILMQYELVFPFIFILLKKIGDKFNKVLPCIITLISSIILTIYFYKINAIKGINISYYNTFSRLFSIIFGLSIGFIHSYYGPQIIKKQKLPRIIFYMYLIALISMFIFVESANKYMPFFMILVTIITCRLIDYGTNKINNNTLIQNISYEIYLLQYPIIYLFENINININTNIKTLLIILIIIILSYVLHFALNKTKYKKLRIITYAIIIIITLYGMNKYFLAQDYTKEMQELKEQLAQNEKMIEENNQNYNKQIEQEEDEWAEELKKMSDGEAKIKEIVKKLPIVGIGDSVMLGAISNLYNTFPNGLFDAKISRTAWSAKDILKNLKDKNMLGYPILIHLGTNGDCSNKCKEEIVEIIENKKIYWINTTNLKYVNDNLKTFASNYTNIHIIDWESISKNHNEYFYADGIHLTPIGRKAYTNVIYETIYNDYLKEYKSQQEIIIKEHEEKQKNKVTFYGDETLLNAFEEIKNNFKDSYFVINNFDNIKKQIKENQLTHQIVFIFDNLEKEKYKEVIELCENNQVYIIDFNNELELENVKIINFSKKQEYLMPDGKHLNETGNSELSEILKKTINN